MGVVIFDNNDKFIPSCIGKSSEKAYKKQDKNHLKQNFSKDIVGNSKEVRMDNNRSNLRIIGNGNKIRINHNSGNLDIVGNDTRVKIVKNSGLIKYTGNSGRIYLGSDSAEQAVDYVGCNGILKVLNTADIRMKSGVLPECEEKCNLHGNSLFTARSSLKTDTSIEKNPKIPPLFNNLNIRNNISLPDLYNTNSEHNMASNIINNFSLSCNTGSVLIKNAVKVVY